MQQEESKVIECRVTKFGMHDEPEVPHTGFIFIMNIVVSFCICS